MLLGQVLEEQYAQVFVFFDGLDFGWGFGQFFGHVCLQRFGNFPLVEGTDGQYHSRPSQGESTFGELFGRPVIQFEDEVPEALEQSLHVFFDSLCLAGVCDESEEGIEVQFFFAGTLFEQLSHQFVQSLRADGLC